MIITLCLFAAAGCQESESAQIQKARLVGSENIKLKQQIEAKDEDIKNLKAEIVQLKAENAKIQEESGNTSIKVLQMMSASEQKAAALAQENKQLKEEIKKLKGQ
jgi:cell division protein FtsB